jgi:hypothetical protein
VGKRVIGKAGEKRGRFNDGEKRGWRFKGGPSSNNEWRVSEHDQPLRLMMILQS